jgi:hypothetical protein
VTIALLLNESSFATYFLTLYHIHKTLLAVHFLAMLQARLDATLESRSQQLQQLQRLQQHSSMVQASPGRGCKAAMRVFTHMITKTSEKR